MLFKHYSKSIISNFWYRANVFLSVTSYETINLKKRFTMIDGLN